MLLPLTIFANNYSTVWQSVEGEVPTTGTQIIFPQVYKVYATNDYYLRNMLGTASKNVDQAEVIELPTPDGNLRTFKVWNDPMMEQKLADEYPNIQTFTAVALDNHNVTAKLDFTDFGFHAIVFDGSNTFFIDPYSNKDDGYYMSYYKHDYVKPLNQRMKCEFQNNDYSLLPNEDMMSRGEVAKMLQRTNGLTKKTYRLALACTGEYAVAVAGSNPTKAAVLAKMITSMNRVNGVYERELAVHMSLIANEDTLIFLDATTDPYSNSNGSSMLSQNQTTVTNRIGSANYDIGHVFSTGGGGIAQRGCVCHSSDKAMGVTGSPSPVGDGFDIDYVAHEMGHQYGANHSFNDNSMGSCNTNADPTTAYEPGSGSTIMAYAGICTNDNIQAHSDAYFHAISLTEISNYITTGTGASCASTSASNDNPPTIAAFTHSYSIPYKTPFELTAPAATDADHDTLTYCWEQWNLGDFSNTWANTYFKGPIYRSFNPDTSRTRVFVNISKLLLGTTSYLGEKLPDTARYLTFKCTVRDIYNGIGTFNFPDDTVHLDVTQTSGPFTVLTPSTAVNWLGSSSQTVTWDPANTTTAPVSAANVDIFLSVDGGHTFPYLVKANTPNDGSETITVPNVSTTNQARIKVKGSNNVFFNINPTNFNITFNTGVTQIGWSNEINIFPIPANDVVHVTISNNMKLNALVYDAVGRKIWIGTLLKEMNIPVSNWAKGVYYLQLTDELNGNKVVKSLLIQ